MISPAGTDAARGLQRRRLEVVRQRRRVVAGQGAARQREDAGPEDVVVDDAAAVRAHGHDDADEGRPEREEVRVACCVGLVQLVEVVEDAVSGQDGGEVLVSCVVVVETCLSECRY